MKPAVDYLQEAYDKLPAFMEKLQKEIPRRVNREECLSIFKANGFFKSYSIRMKVSERKNESVKSKVSKKELE